LQYFTHNQCNQEILFCYYLIHGPVNLLVFKNNKKTNKRPRFWDRIVSEFASRFACWAQLCYFLAWERRPIPSPKRNVLWLAISIRSNPWGFQKVESPWYHDSRHKKVVRLSAVRTDRLPPPRPGTIPGTHVCWRLSRPQGHSAAGRIMTSSGIELATFRLVELCLNQLRYRVPPFTTRTILNFLGRPRPSSPLRPLTATARKICPNKDLQPTFHD
jgi:hypothetical protein